MRPLLAVATAALTAAATAGVPAYADAPPTDCARPLVAVKAGQATGCDTYSNLFRGDPMFRRATLVVTSGAATATLTCGGFQPTSVTIALSGPGARAGLVVQGGGYCWVTVTANAPNTTAVVASNSDGTASLLDLG